MNNKHRHPFTTRTTRLLAAPAILGAGVMAAWPSTAAADEVTTGPLTCGSVVTTDVRLSADLVDCPGSGLVVGASGVTIDLAGHVIDGTGWGAGIDNGAGHDDVRVTRGTVRQFLFGVHLFETDGAEIDRLGAQANSIGVIIERSEAVVLHRVSATDNAAAGIDITFSEGIAVRRSTAAQNGLGGIVDRFSTGSTYERNTLTGNAAPGLVVDRTEGLVAVRNHAVANDADGIQLVAVEDAVLERNEAIANGENGFSIDAPGNTLTRNRAVNNQGIGIAAPDGTIDGGGNRASDNLGGDCTGGVCR